ARRPACAGDRRSPHVRCGAFRSFERSISDTAILAAGCNEPRAGARGKLSTVSVDNPAEKICRPRDSCCFRLDSVICLNIRQNRKLLISKERFFNVWQTLEKSGLFVTAL